MICDGNFDDEGSMNMNMDITSEDRVYDTLIIRFYHY